MNNFPCKCGHLEIDHPSEDRDYVVCDGCFLSNRVVGVKQLNRIDCEKYIPDNLKYLEQIYESKF